MVCDVQRNGNVIVMRLHGKVTLGPGPEEEWPRFRIEKLLESGERFFVIDIRDLELRPIDAPLIGELLAMFKGIKIDDGIMKIVANAEQQQVFRNLRLTSVLDLHDDLESAIAASHAR